MVRKTWASVPAPYTSPVITDTLYVWAAKGWMNPDMHKRDKISTKDWAKKVIVHSNLMPLLLWEILLGISPPVFQVMLRKVEEKRHMNIFERTNDPLAGWHTLQSIFHIHFRDFQASVSWEFLSDDGGGHQLSHRFSVILWLGKPTFTWKDDSLWTLKRKRKEMDALENDPWFVCALFARKGRQCVWLSQQWVCYRAELPSSVFKENISPYWTKVSLPDISIKMTNTVYFKASASRIVYACFILVAWHMMICYSIKFHKCV